MHLLVAELFFFFVFFFCSVFRFVLLLTSGWIFARRLDRRSLRTQMYFRSTGTSDRPEIRLHSHAMEDVVVPHYMIR